MQTAMCFKPNGGIGQLAVSQQSQATLVPWWVGTQPLYGESFGQLKSVAGNCGENQVVAAPRQMNHVMDQRTGQGPAISDEECGDTAKFSIFQGKTSYRMAVTFLLFLASAASGHLVMGSMILQYFVLCHLRIKQMRY